MSDDEYEQALGSEDSEPALEPNAPAAEDEGSGTDPFEGGPLETIRRVRIPRTEAGRKAMADAIAKFKSERTPEDDEEGFGEPDESAAGTPVEKSKPAAPSPPAATASASVTATAPPAPSLDAEVMRQRELLTAKLGEADKKLADADKARESVGGVIDHEQYLENSPKAFRGWLEAMRGSAMTDDEFRQEAADFVTLVSGDVLGVKLPDEVKSRIESQLTRKALSAYKANASRREIAEANKREADRVQREWDEARQSLDTHFADETNAKAYPYLALADSPGTIVVDVIQSALRKDGTKLSWQEASKQANDYLKKHDDAYNDKRRRLLSAAPATETPVNGDAAKAKQTERPGKPTGTQQVTRSPATEAVTTPPEMPVVRKHKPGSTWDREAHRRETRRAFAEVFKPEE